MKQGVRSTSSIFQFAKWKLFRWNLQRKQNKLLKLYEGQKYDQIISLFKTQKDYQQLTFDSFPFLYFMINQNNTKAVNQFVSKYPHSESMYLNDSNPLKCTPIQYSILQNKQEVEQVLQNNGANVHVCNSQGQNAMHLSAIYQRKQAFDICIKKNIDFNKVDSFGNTPFHYACRAGSVQMITAMIAAKAKKIANKLDQYPIHMAIESGKLQCASLLENDISRAYPKFHPIHSAARSNNVQMFKYIYEKNQKFIQEKDQNQSNALHHAVSLQDIEISKFILQGLPRNSALILDSQDSYGNTPLHLAFLNGNIQILRHLTQRKANLNIKNNDQMTPIDYGLTSNKEEVKRFLLDLEGWKQHSERI